MASCVYLWLSLCSQHRRLRTRQCALPGDVRSKAHSFPLLGLLECYQAQYQRHLVLCLGTCQSLGTADFNPMLQRDELLQHRQEVVHSQTVSYRTNRTGMRVWNRKRRDAKNQSKTNLVSFKLFPGEGPRVSHVVGHQDQPSPALNVCSELTPLCQTVRGMISWSAVWVIIKETKSVAVLLYGGSD